jgi:hypothetical protein
VPQGSHDDRRGRGQQRDRRLQAAPTLYSTPVKVAKGYSLSLSGTKDDVKATLFRRRNGTRRARRRLQVAPATADGE